MKLSDEIEEFIKRMFSEEQECIEFQRNVLAEKFSVVPSQINYVISTRFKPSQGYYVESRRGGGGYIKIRKTSIVEGELMNFVINDIGDKMSALNADIIISDLLTDEIISQAEARLLKAATNDSVLKLEAPLKDEVRARILKNMIINLDENSSI